MCTIGVCMCWGVGVSRGGCVCGMGMWRDFNGGISYYIHHYLLKPGTILLRFRSVFSYLPTYAKVKPAPSRFNFGVNSFRNCASVTVRWTCALQFGSLRLYLRRMWLKLELISFCALGPLSHCIGVSLYSVKDSQSPKYILYYISTRRTPCGDGA